MTKSKNNFLKGILISFAMILILFGTLLLTGCKDEEPNVPPSTYTITCKVNDSNMGQLSFMGNVENFDGDSSLFTYTDYYDSKITVIAEAKAGYYFDSWENGDTNERRYITITETQTYTAYFKKGEAVKVGAYRVAVQNGTIDKSQTNDFNIVIKANNTDTFGYWHLENSNEILDSGTYYTIRKSLVKQSMTIVGEDTKIGFFFGTLKDEESLNLLNNSKPKTLEQLQNMNIFTDYACHSTEVQINNFTLVETDIQEDLTSITYAVTLNYSYDWLTQIRLFKVIGSEDIYVKILGGYNTLNTVKFSVNYFPKEDLKIVLRANFNKI